ncbi:MAG: MBL fold metallo-hydrolase, partial [Candidatus Dormibacteria bacterium]
MTSPAVVTSIEAPFTVNEVGILQFPTPGLGDNSYLLHSGGEAVIVDPQRDLERFRAALREHDLRLIAVVETHVHNDYVSGGPALAREFGAMYVVPAQAGYELEHRPVAEGDLVHVGAIRLRALHTPGHTEHHMSYEVVEGSEVRAVFSGGSVLVGACGRTDLVSP